MDTEISIFLKNKSWKAYCISLPRCIERRNKFTTWASEHGLTFTFWDAFDKYNLSETNANKINIGKTYSPGATACRRSHEELWKHILEKDHEEYFFIFEDDAGFRSKSYSDLKEFLENCQKIQKQWSILQFGFGTMTGSELHLLSRRNPPNIYQVDFCDQMHANLYTKNAIQELFILSKDEKYKTRPSDGLLLSYLQKKKGIILAPKESIIQQIDTISYIST